MVRNSLNKKKKEKREEVKGKNDNFNSVANDSANLTDMSDARSRENSPDKVKKSDERKGKGKKKKDKLNPSPGARKSPRKKGKLNYRSMHSGKDLCLVIENENEKEEDVSDNSNKCQKVQFEEDGNLIEMEAEGMDTEFLSDVEEGLLEDSEVEDSEEETQFETVVEVPEQFEVSESSMNNNATTSCNTGSVAGRVAKKSVKEGKEKCISSTRKRKATSQGEKEDSEREDRIVNKTVARLQAIMSQGGYMINQNNQQADVNYAKRGKNVELLNPSNSPSESTIYKVAVQPAVTPGMEGRGRNTQKRKSSSSEEGDELDNDHVNTDNLLVNSNFIENFISECCVAMNTDQNMPSTSGYQQQQQRRSHLPPPPPQENNRRFGGGFSEGGMLERQERPERPITAERRSEDIIRRAETAKARMIELPGNQDLYPMGTNILSNGNNVQSHTTQSHSSFIDDEYCIVAAHIDDCLKKRIEDGEYVDFNKLLLRDISGEDDNRLELVYRQGKTYWVPVNSSSHNNEITSFARWEQAFRVYSNIYTLRHPDRASELIQYNHLINTAALTFSWENVYLYDRDFRRHMSRHPQRSWAVILQQAWTIRLKDRHKSSSFAASGASSDSGSHKKKSGRREICFRFNRGKCSYGDRCKFEHKCGICNRYGHGAHNCRRGYEHTRSGNDHGDRDHGGKRTKKDKDEYNHKKQNS